MLLYLMSFTALAAALAYWGVYAGNDATSTAASVIKTLSTALLAVVGWTLGAPGWVVLGLAFGSLGDLALSRPGDRAFLAGMVAFAVGHLAYVIAFAAQVGEGDPALTGLFWATLTAMAALIPFTALWIAPKAEGFAWPVRAYAVIIGAMALSASLLPPSEGRWIVQIGVAGFVASDLILALRLFVMRNPRARLIAARSLWPLYWGGQALILAGSLL